MALRTKLRRIKRFAYLGVLVGTGVGVKRMRDRRAAPTFGPPASWPPLQPSEEVPVAAIGDLAADPRPTDTPQPTPSSAAAAGTAAAPATWVHPLEDGSCPLSHPIKANDNSSIYHQPGGRFYERTRAERCYADPAAAEADGYRAAKGAGGADTTPGGST